ncbi:DUF934 domain-containing protein [Stappia sp. GBMRC 2046]|uniref:DUF934 domain-containing protein n=1 Tax=Stappia sediminis TaxID=2692190 RepID=A0A7X3LW87_9HYPH|nr:DUF934 domain-containing protein [Stappia sediminis]MXN66260.1 DUF934 domain-containing protein [Stappia sediminis]
MSNTIYKNGIFGPNEWAVLEDEADLPESGKVLVSPDRFLALEGSAPEGVELGVVIRAGEKAERLVAHLAKLPMVAIDFPKFSDGRGYSSARLLREKFGYKGELRAIGDVLIDQIPFMIRCGIGSFEISHAPTRRALEEDRLNEVPIYLQPVGRDGEVPLGTRPWARRRVA